MKGHKLKVWCCSEKGESQKYETHDVYNCVHVRKKGASLEVVYIRDASSQWFVWGGVKVTSCFVLHTGRILLSLQTFSRYCRFILIVLES